MKRLVCESNIYDDYEDLLCEFFDVDDISKITPWMYKKALQDYEYDNLNEHDSSLLEDATLLVHEAAKQHGYNVIAHHGTDKKFSEFKYGDIGFHLGTLEQARLAGKSHTPFGAGDDEIVFLNVALSLHNPLILESDPESWEPDDIVDGALNLIYRYRRLAGLDEKEDFHAFAKNQDHIDFVDKKIKDAIQSGNIVIDSEEKYDRSSISFLILYQLLKFTLLEIINLREEKVDTKKALVNRAKSLGHDGIQYLNLFEVDHESDEREYSYIVFDANQIKNCEVISFKNGKIVPLEERFNSNSNNLFETKIDKEHLIHCPECWEELDDRRWTKDYKGFKWVTCPNCGERICINPNE